MIEIRDLVARYGDVTVLDGVDLSIADGEFVVITGPNGSGKTTLVRHCNALETPENGTVLVDGIEAAAQPVAARTAVGMVFQNPRDQFVAGTVGADVAFGPENLGLSRDEIDDRVATALGAVGMDGRNRERIDALSGGEQARVAIAGALAMEPTHLILDEPMTGLDAAGRRSVWTHLDRLHEEGTSIVVVTHDLRDVWERAERLVALASGEIAIDAAPEAARDHLPDIDVQPPC